MNCLYCNKPIEGKRNTKKYCGNTCKQYAYLNRNFVKPETLQLSIPQNTLTNVKTDIALSSNTPISNNQNITQHEYKINQNTLERQEEEYQNIYPIILLKIQQEMIDLSIDRQYFTSNTSRGGRITNINLPAFQYMVPRVLCIIENLFQLSYKRKVYYKTLYAISEALNEMILSKHAQNLPDDFPFMLDLLKLAKQLNPMVKSLEGDKDGIKFVLTKTAIVRYIIILDLIRDCAKKESFQNLFPEICNPKPKKEPERPRKYAT